MTVVAGVDFGTRSVRVSIVDVSRGQLGAGTSPYRVRTQRHDPEFATQRHGDHVVALQSAFASALVCAKVRGSEIAALAVATTGSTVAPVDEHLQPIGDYYLWCDHRASPEARQITQRAHETGLEAIAWTGGTYSPEWGFAKVLHWLRHNPTRRGRFATAMEHCDLITATLCGITDPAKAARSICAMGHKWMWNESLGGLPSEGFLGSIDPLLVGLRAKLKGHYGTSVQVAGELSPDWSARLGLRAGIPMPIGALDAHWDAAGAGCQLGDVVNVLGTSSCVMAMSEKSGPIPGVSGVVKGSIDPQYFGIEAGLAAVGDLFAAIARRARMPLESLLKHTAGYRAGQTGLLRLAWDNGDRSILANPLLRGVTVGWHLGSTAGDELFAAMEGIAFQTRIILERLQEYGVPVRRLIHAGGIPRRNQQLNQIFASVLGREVLVPATDTTGLGSAMFAALAAGCFSSLQDAQRALVPAVETTHPRTADEGIYAERFAEFKELYFTLGKRGRGTPANSGY